MRSTKSGSILRSSDVFTNWAVAISVGFTAILGGKSFTFTKFNVYMYLKCPSTQEQTLAETHAVTGSIYPDVYSFALVCALFKTGSILVAFITSPLIFNFPDMNRVCAFFFPLTNCAKSSSVKDRITTVSEISLIMHTKPVTSCSRRSDRRN